MITEHDKLSDVIGRNIDLLPIIHRLGLSSNIGGRNIGDICSQNAADVNFVLIILNTYSSDNYFPKPDDLELKPLIDFLTQTHTYHKQVTIPRLNGFVQQLKQNMPDEKLLLVIEEYLNQYIKKLIQHIDFEEKDIFPLVNKKKMVDEKPVNIKKLFRGGVDENIKIMEFQINSGQDHDGTCLVRNDRQYRRGAGLRQK